MNFTSLTFLIFFLLVLTFYWFAREKNIQNSILLLTSYLFLGWYRWQFALLLGILTIADYVIILQMILWPEQRERKRWLVLGIGLNLGSLFLFKYFNFFSESIRTLFYLFGFQISTYTLDLLLPLGISFYTLKKISYLLDIYRKTVLPEKNFIQFALYAAFFPQVVAGPIESHRNFFSQIAQRRIWSKSYFVAAWPLLIMGFFKKIVIADNVKIIVDKIYLLGEPPKFLLLAGTLAFTLQILMDFSAYTDLARGFAYLLGLETSKNFNNPYLAISPTQFWDRWHITFSNWLRDYIFFPIRRSLVRKYRHRHKYLPLLLPPLITMLLSGLWHGVGRTYLFWGLFHGIIIIIYQALGLGGSWRPQGKVKMFFAWMVMFALIVFSWSIFRAPSLFWLYNAWFRTPWTATQYDFIAAWVSLSLILFYALFLIIKLLIDRYFPKSDWVQGFYFATVTVLIIIYINTGSSDFIYAQF